MNKTLELTLAQKFIEHSMTHLLPTPTFFSLHFCNLFPFFSKAGFPDSRWTAARTCMHTHTPSTGNTFPHQFLCLANFNPTEDFNVTSFQKQPLTSSPSPPPKKEPGPCSVAVQEVPGRCHGSDKLICLLPRQR